MSQQSSKSRSSSGPMDAFISPPQRERPRSVSGQPLESVDMSLFMSRSSSAMSLGSETESLKDTSWLSSSASPLSHSQASGASDQTPTPAPQGGAQGGDRHPDVARGEGITAEHVDEVKAWMRDLSKFYKVKSVLQMKAKPGHPGKKVFNGEAICQKCLPKSTLRRFWTDQRSNLKSHYKSAHSAKDYDELHNLCERISKRGLKPSAALKAEVQLTMKESLNMSSRFNQAKGREAWTNWFVRCVIPLSITDHQATRDMMRLFRPDFKVPSRSTLTRDVKRHGDRAKKELMAILNDLPHVATTADSWTSHNRAFIGCTVHWLCPKDLSRRQATLAIKEIKVSQTKEVVATQLDKINRLFSISRKIVLTTTDNGANYVSAFKLFGGLRPHQAEEEDDEVLEAVLSAEDQEDEEEREGLEIIDIHQALNAADAVDEANFPRLPKHQRCSAHTVNLLATNDVSQVRGWNHGTSNVPFRKSLSKAQGLWNLQNRSSTSANSIKEAIGRKLKTPVPTRWNTLYDSIDHLLKTVMDCDAHVEAINEVLMNERQKEGRGRNRNNRPAYSTFEEEDKEVLNEYVRVMRPVATCLDRLQGEEYAYMGVLLPTLTLMRVMLEKLDAERGDQAPRYAKPLVSALLHQEGDVRGFNNRFGKFFEEKDLLMASALHPNHGPSTLLALAPHLKDLIHDRIVREMKALLRPEGEVRVPANNREERMEQPHEEADPFAALYQATQEPVSMQADVEEDIKKELSEWKRSKEPKVKKEQFPAKYRQEWLKLFIKYNTGIPSSAAVERLFSTAGDVLRPKRACLSESNFETLVFLKGNLHLLKDLRHQEEEEEEVRRMTCEL